MVQLSGSSPRCELIMKIVKVADDVRIGVFELALVICLLQPFGAHAAIEQTFDMLQIGTTTYRNVTVTTKSKNYIFILHSKGMTNIKVAELPQDLRTKLGYDVPPSHETKTNTPALWARQTLTKLEAPQVKQLETRLLSWYQRSPGARLKLPPLSRNVGLLICAGLLALYLFHSYCCMLICRKAGSEPGPLVWLPLLQLLPLLKAASMSPLWFLAFLVPGLNLAAQVFWCINITQARRKTLFVALLLIFPLSSPFAALYLAFSGGARVKRDDRRVEIMTLETA